MGFHLVKQPNGLYARFSSTVDTFTHYHMDKAEAREVLAEDVGRRLFEQYFEDADEGGKEKLLHDLQRVATVYGQEEYARWEKVLLDPTSTTRYDPGDE